MPLFLSIMLLIIVSYQKNSNYGYQHLMRGVKQIFSIYSQLVVFYLNCKKYTSNFCWR